MYDNREKIASLKQIITTTLLPLIDDDYSLLDAPNYNNIGDSLIYEGELAFLKLSPHKSLFSASIKFTDMKVLPEKGIILLQGGGNFGDLWTWFQNFRREIIAARHQQKIIIFPQTVYYEKQENILKDAAVFNAHPDLTICARDQRSYELLKEYFHKNRVLLLPDMAFCLNLEKYHRKEQTGKILLMEHLDQEHATGPFEPRQIFTGEDQGKPADIEDWPGIRYTDFQKKYWQWKVTANRYTTRLMLFLNLPTVKIDRNFGVWGLFHSHNQMERGIQFLNQYDSIYSTRLHGAILAILLNIPVYILDNSYGKNSAFYYQWLTEFESCNLIE